MNHRPYRAYSGKLKKPVLVRIILALLLIGVLCFGALTGYIALWNRDRIQGEPKTMIVLGCRVMPWGDPSVLLMDRLEKAAEYFEAYPDMTVVVSGGQGDDEPDTEANVMKNILLEKGIPEERILTENWSYSTWQNLRNSISLLETEGYDLNDGILVVSSGFHLGRVNMLWKRLGVDYELSMLAAPASHTLSRWKMHFREPVGLVKSFLFDR